MAAIAYLVHDLADPAVERRVRMLRAGGAELALAGFRRRAPQTPGDAMPPVDLGKTADARLKQRAAAVARHLAHPALARTVTAGADAIVARHLEALAIAVRVARPEQRVIFECLDIHRLLTAAGPAGAGLRLIERRLLARADLVLTSSPAFEREYFRRRRGYGLPIRVEENRVLTIDDRPAADRNVAREGPPWRIGWFGMLRCARSLAILRDLVARSNGRVEVLMAGVPSLTEFADFHRDVVGLPGLRYVGTYGVADLPDLYSQVHFAWAIDYFEEGLNSTWLLPNRLYESLAHGAVPIALTSVETGRWLASRDVGLRLDNPAAELPSLLGGLDQVGFQALVAAAAALPASDLFATRADCVALTRAVLGEVP